MKAKTLFLTDLLLLIAFIPASATGFILHWAGHQTHHELWHNWAIAHIISTLLLTIMIVIHIYDHWGWYKSLFRNGIKNKSRATIVLSVLMLVVITTGHIVLFRHQGANSDFGLKHYILGVALSVIAVGHFIRRHRILFKGLESKK